MIEWSKSKLTKDDHLTIGRIVNRAMVLLASEVPDNRLQDARLSMVMDLEACCITCPLDLGKLACFDDFNLVHDVGGINLHIDRETGILNDCFLPRCALPEAAATVDAGAGGEDE